MHLSSQSGEGLVVVDGNGGLSRSIATSAASGGSSSGSFTSVTSVAASSTSGTASSFTSGDGGESALVFKIDLLLLGAGLLLGGLNLLLLWYRKRGQSRATRWT